MDLVKVVRDALKAKNPELYRQLEAGAKLQEFCSQRADEIWEAVSDMVSDSPEVKKAYAPESTLSLIEKAAVANTQQASAMEIALNDLLEFPRDATSRPKPDDTSASGRTT